MVKDSEEREKLLRTFDDLKKERTLIVSAEIRIAKIESRAKMVALESRRIESATILDVHRAILDNGKSAYPDEWSRKARVEEILAKHERFNTLIKKYSLLQKQLARKRKIAGLSQIKVQDLESREKLALLA